LPPFSPLQSPARVPRIRLPRPRPPPPFLSFTIRRPPTPTLFPYTTLFRSVARRALPRHLRVRLTQRPPRLLGRRQEGGANAENRSEEHTSELQSRGHLVCRLLLEKKNRVHGVGAIVDAAVMLVQLRETVAH